MKKILLSFFFGINFVSLQAQSISIARSAPVGSTVTVKGIITNGSELGSIRYLQDNSAGIAAYGGTASIAGFTNTTKGDSVSITGVTKLYNNLLEIDPVIGYTVHAVKPEPNPIIITPSAISESLEGKLIAIQNCTFSTAGNFTTTSANYTVTSNSQSFVVRVVATATTITGTAIPTGPVNIKGILSQFCSTPTTGCTSGYQLLIRTNLDISNFSGISEVSNNIKLAVYPNPASDILNINIEEINDISKITICDMIGQEVYSNFTEFNKINTSEFNNGLYTISVFTKSNIYQSKFSILK